MKSIAVMNEARRTRSGWTKPTLTLALVCLGAAVSSCNAPARLEEFASAQPPSVGTIEPSDEVGTLPGRLAVNSDGSVSYGIPLWVPVGRAGVQPSLGLSYSSRGENGLLGVGWSLAGLSAVTQCRATWAIDGANAPTTHPHCLDGERLVEVASSTIANLPPGCEVDAEYRTIPDSLARVVQCTRGTWHVYAKDGSIRHYATTVATAALLDRAEDRNGNAMVYTYVPGTDQPSTIEYTAGPVAPTRTIHFEYEDRPDVIRRNDFGDRNPVYTTSLTVSQRLKRIKVVANDETLRTYELSYCADPDEPLTCFSPATLRTRLVGVRTCDRESELGGRCLPMTKFGYSSDADGAGPWSRNPIEVTGTVDPELNGSDPIYFADFNGDGRDDLLYRAGISWWMRPSSGLDFDANAFEVPHSGTQGVVSDLNGDGAMDVVVGNPNLGRPQAFLWDPGAGRFVASSYTLPPKWNAPVQVVDLAGDGVPRYVDRAPDGELQVYKNPFLGPDQVLDEPAVFPHQASQSIIRDLGGAPGYVFLTGMPNGSVRTRRWRVDGTFSSLAGFPPDRDEVGSCPVWADFTGDGWLDVINPITGELFGLVEDRDPDGPFPWSYSGFGTPWIPPVSPETPLPGCGDGAYQVADVNGDGRMDVVVLGRSDPDADDEQVRAFLTRPDGNGAELLTIGVLLANPGSAPMKSHLLDVNGDGAFDIFQMTGETTFRLEVQRSNPSDLLESVTDGMGRADRVTYNSMANATEFTRCWDRGCFEDSMQIATELALDDGNGGVARFSHQYAGARMDRKGAGFLGFDVHVVTDLRNGTVVRETYDNTRLAPGAPADTAWYANRGRPIEVLTYVLDVAGNGQTWNARRTTTAYLTRRTSSDATYFTFPFATGTRTYAGLTFDPTPAGVPSPHFDCGAHPRCPGITSAADELHIEDQFGNTLLESITRHVMTPGATGAFEDSVLYGYDAPDNDESRWLIGRPTTMTTFSGAPGFDSPPARRLTLAYDDRGNLVTTEREPEDMGTSLYQRTKLVRDPANGVVTQVLVAPDGDDDGARVRQTIIAYDPTFTYPISTTRTTGGPTVSTLTSSSTVHTGLGVMLQSTGVDGVTTSFDYDGFGRPRATRTEERGTSSTSYGGAEAPYAMTVSTTGSDGSRHTTWLDRLGRGRRTTQSAFDGRDAIVDTTYDAMGRVVSVTRPYFEGDPIAYAIAYGYDQVGRLARIGRRDAPGVVREATTRFYSGNQVFTYDEVNNASMQESDGAGHVVKTFTMPDETWLATTYQYGPFDLLRTVTDPKSNVVTIEYDDLGRRTDLTDGDIGHVHTDHDEFDQPILTTDARGITTALVYDHLGRLTSRTDPDGTDTFVWDTGPGAGLGKLTSKERGDISTTFTYDDFGRVLSDRRVIDGEEFDYDFTYDPLGRLELLKYPAKGTSGIRFTVQHHYNTNGYLREIQDATDPSDQRSIWVADLVDAEGRVRTETLGNGRVTHQEYDPVSGLLAHGWTPEIHDVSYDYRANGTLLSRTDHLNAPEGFTSGPPPYYVARTESFTYDRDNRLESATVAGRDPETYHWTYDELGNVLTSDDQSACSFEYGGPGYGPHQMSRANCFGTPYAPSYDASGNELFTVSPDFRQQTWTAFDKQLEVTTRYGRMRYTYDADHARVKKEKVPGTLPWQSEPDTPTPNDGLSGVWSTTLYAGGLFERRRSSAPTIDHVYTVQAGSRTVAQLTWKQSQSDPAVGTDEWRYFHSDAQGTVERTTDAAGSLKEVQSFDAWGARRNPDWTKRGEAFALQQTRASYTGHEYEDEFSSFLIGLINMGGRTYDPFAKRFTSADPLVQAPLYGPSWNRYSYVFNSPTNFTDPTGYCGTGPWDVCPWQPIFGESDDGGGGGGGGPQLPQPIPPRDDGPHRPYVPGNGEKRPLKVPRLSGTLAVTGAASELADRTNATTITVAHHANFDDIFEAVQRGTPIMGTVVLRRERLWMRSDTVTEVRVWSGKIGWLLDGKLYSVGSYEQNGRADGPDFGPALALGLFEAHLAGTLARRVFRIPGPRGGAAASTPPQGAHQALETIAAARGAASIPGRVQSRINISNSGWSHVVERHFTGSGSPFSISQAELRTLLSSRQVVGSPVVRTLESADGIRYLREVDIGRIIGFDKFAGADTSILSVMSDKFGNLVTSFPGVLK